MHCNICNAWFASKWATTSPPRSTVDDFVGDWKCELILDDKCKLMMLSTMLRMPMMMTLTWL